MAFSSTSIWMSLSDDQITSNSIQDLLGSVDDDAWVVTACVDRVLNDTTTQRVILNTGISRTIRIVETCTDTVALKASPNEHSPPTTHDILQSYFQARPTDGLVCYLRSVLLRRLDRVNTYDELKTCFDNAEMVIDEVNDEWEDDPWAGENAVPLNQPLLSSKYTGPLPITLSQFIRNDLTWSACELASLEAFQALKILLRRHGSTLWPGRFKILECIPEHTHPTFCRGLFPSLDIGSNKELPYAEDSWRLNHDYSEGVDVQETIRDFISSSHLIGDCDKKVEYVNIEEPLSAEGLSAWYKTRASTVVTLTGMVDIALALVQHGASQGIPLLDELGEELSLLSRLVYDAPQGQDGQDDWTLDIWHSLSPIDVVRGYLANSTPESIARDISHLVMPYLFVLEARAERAGNPDPKLPNRILYEFVLTTSLELAAAIFDASKPTLPSSQRIIKQDEDLARIALACLYGSNEVDEWPTMSRIFECLPVWDVDKDMEDPEEAADTTVTSLGTFVTPNTNQSQCPAQDLLLFFQPLPFTSLSRALDILDVHLESGEILSRWSVAAPLRWFLQSSDNVDEQRAWANRMARRAGGKDDRLDGIEDWEWLLKDMRKLTGGDSTSRGAFSLLSKDEVDCIFLNGLLSTGNFDIAKRMLYGPNHKLKLNAETIESLCLSCSREFYDNANSGNYKFGEMKLAYECLDVPQPSPNTVKEKNFIEATSRICSFNVPSGPGLTISPLEIRLTKDRLSLISRVISSNNDAYKHTQVMLDLSDKLGYTDDPVAEVKVRAMLADAALQAEDFSRAYENIEHIVHTVTNLRNNSTSDRNDAQQVKEACEVCWISCFQLGRQQEYNNLSQKMTLLGYALEFCPSDKIHDVLAAWCKLDREFLQTREGRPQQQQRFGLENGSSRTMYHNPGSVASSLRARLQDLHMPSPPLLSTPDAAALASRTFKTVAANFPFAVGHRDRSHTSTSDIDESASQTSDAARRIEGEDVSSQASRVLSKGIGWLIGADEGI